MAGIDQDADDLPSAITNRDQYEGWRGSIETRGLFSLSSWWKFGWDVTLESDDTFRRFYKLDNILLTDRVNKIFLNGISDRNYFGAELYHFGGLMFTDTPKSESLAHPIIDYNYVFADPVFGGELRWNTNALSFSNNLDGLTPIAAGPTLNGTETMNRIVTDLSWRKRFVDPIGLTYTPFGQLRGDIYQLSNYVNPDDPVGNGGHPARARRGACRRHRLLPVGRQRRLRLARHRADRPDHRPPEQRAAGRPA